MAAAAGPASGSLTRYAATVLLGLHVSTDHRGVGEALMRMSLGAMRPIVLGHTLDFDSTVFCRSGEQAGSLTGHHPVTHGRPAPHPVVAWLSERRQRLGATRRAGHAGTANGARECLAHALTRRPPGYWSGLVRADAGFWVTAFLAAWAARALPSLIVARLTPLVRTGGIPRIPEVEWRPVARGIAVADVPATVLAWRGQARRFVCLRQTLAEHPAARGRRLLECPGYTYRIFVTTVPSAAEWVTRMDAGRADREHRLKARTEELAWTRAVSSRWMPTAAAFRTGCVLYNLLMGVRETVLPSCWFERRLRAVRDVVFLVGAALILQARRLRVRFAGPTEERTEFLDRLRTLSEGLPIAAQLDWELREAADTDHTPARDPHATVPAVLPQRTGALPELISPAESGFNRLVWMFPRRSVTVVAVTVVPNAS